MTIRSKSGVAKISLPNSARHRHCSTAVTCRVKDMSRWTKGYVTLNKRICHAQQKDMSRSTKGYVTLNKRMCHAQQKDVSRSTKGCVTLNKRICHAQQKDMSRSTKGYVTLNKITPSLRFEINFWHNEACDKQTDQKWAVELARVL